MLGCQRLKRNPLLNAAVDAASSSVELKPRLYGTASEILSLHSEAVVALIVLHPRCFRAPVLKVVTSAAVASLPGMCSS